MVTVHLLLLAYDLSMMFVDYFLCFGRELKISTGPIRLNRTGLDRGQGFVENGLASTKAKVWTPNLQRGRFGTAIGLVAGREFLSKTPRKMESGRAKKMIR